MWHIDLFSGIGGFALAAEMVWDNVRHTFVEYDPFCQEVLKKHWPEADLHGDIRKFVADAKKGRREGRQVSIRKRRSLEASGDSERPYIITGGFPCQPFSAAGLRKGTADDRYLWPVMLECITLYRPRWVIAENVAGLATWNEGLVLETVCTDLEKEGYEVQPFVIPATAVGAPHRRDRVWIVAHAEFDGWGQGRRNALNPHAERSRSEDLQNHRDAIRSSPRRRDRDVADSKTKRLQGKRNEALEPQQKSDDKLSHGRDRSRTGKTDWQRNWTEIAATLCRVDDGVPRRLDRSPRLKALGNAIVPQVAAEIMFAIKNS